MAATRQEAAESFATLQRQHGLELAAASDRQRDLQRRHDALAAALAREADTVVGLQGVVAARDAALVAAGEVAAMAAQDAMAACLRDLDKVQAAFVSVLGAVRGRGRSGSGSGVAEGEGQCFRSGRAWYARV